MHWPIQPVEIRRHFAPPFCPRHDCPAHGQRSARRYAYQHHGAFRRADGRRVARYRCGTCLRTFSKQSFGVSYFLKRPELLVPVASGLVNGAAHRQIARTLGCAPSTVTRLAARLGRHGLLLQALALRQLSDDDERTVLDHAEAFEGSQDAPFAVATLVGADSWWCYGLEGCRHERTGRRSQFQEARRRLRPVRNPHGGYQGSAARILALRLRCAGRRQGVVVVCDDKHDYARAAGGPEFGSRIQLVVLPNPSRGPKRSPRSAEARRRDAAMFSNDLLHGLIRHSLAHHHRETIAFPRRINAALERLFLFTVWRNFVKGVSERKPDPTTPAMRKRLTDAPWSWGRVLAVRLFPHRIGPSESWMEIYRRRWVTPALRSNTRHTLRLAY